MTSDKKVKQVEFNLRGQVDEAAVHWHVKNKTTHKGKITDVTIYPKSKSGRTRVRVTLEPE